MLCKVGKSLKNRNMQNTNISLTVQLKNRRFYNLAIFILLKKKYENNKLSLKELRFTCLFV